MFTSVSLAWTPAVGRCRCLARGQRRCWAGSSASTSSSCRLTWSMSTSTSLFLKAHTVMCQPINYYDLLEQVTYNNMQPEIPVTPANAPSTPAYKRSDAEQSTLNLRRRKNKHLDIKNISKTCKQATRKVNCRALSTTNHKQRQSLSNTKVIQYHSYKKGK